MHTSEESENNWFFGGFLAVLVLLIFLARCVVKTAIPPVPTQIEQYNKR